jgi:HK97 family phage major capsid protein
MKLHELKEKRAQAIAKMRGLTDKAEAETRDLSDTEDQEFRTLKDEVAGLDRQIERAQYLADAERSAPAITTGHGDGVFEDRARDFSLVRAINAQLGEDVDAGFEREISSEVKRRSGRKFQGIAVPDEFFHKRTLTTGGAAASLYPEQHRADMFIDLLRDQLVTGRLGATILDNLVGDQDIPKMTGGSTAQWVAEDGALTETDATVADVTMAPKTVGAMTSYSRRTLINAAPSIEQLVRNDLASTVANAIDLQALTGDGTGNTPTGVINHTDAAELTLATPSWAEILDFIATVQTANADLGTMGWTMNPKAVSTLRGTLKESGDAGAGYLMSDPGNLAGYSAIPTAAMPTASGTPDTTTVIFGAWSQLMIGYWSGTDVLVNPYESTAYSRGRVLIRVMRDVDVAIRHGESFAFASDLAV